MDELRLPKHKEKIGYRGNSYSVETEYDALLNRVSVRLFKNRRLVSSRSIRIRDGQIEKSTDREEIEKIKRRSPITIEKNMPCSSLCLSFLKN